MHSGRGSCSIRNIQEFFAYTKFTYNAAEKLIFEITVNILGMSTCLSEHSLCGRGLPPTFDRKGSFWGHYNTTILSFR